MNDANISLYPLTQKSFYGKCKVFKDKNKYLLQSYSTIVAEYNIKTQKIKIHGWYSQTTGKHLNAFLHYFDFPTGTKKVFDDWKGWKAANEI